MFTVSNSPVTVLCGYTWQYKSNFKISLNNRIYKQSNSGKHKVKPCTAKLRDSFFYSHCFWSQTMLFLLKWLWVFTICWNDPWIKLSLFQKSAYIIVSACVACYLCSVMGKQMVENFLTVWTNHNLDSQLFPSAIPRKLLIHLLTNKNSDFQ